MVKGSTVGMLCVLFAVWAQDFVHAQDSSANQQTKAEIAAFLNRFQAGYTKKDASLAGTWTRELMTPDVLIMGTNGVYPNTGEWQTGLEKAEGLFANDWRRWGVLEADLTNADIRLLKPNVAIVAMTATVTKSPENGYGRTNEDNMERCLTRLARLKEDSTKSVQLKLFTALWDAGMVLKHTELGETFVWPIRISMVLIREKDGWKMAQTHYSYPMSAYPPVRLIDGEIVNY